MESLLDQLIIVTFDDLTMEIFDIPGDYINANMKEDKLLLLELKDGFVDIMCEFNP